MSADYEPGTVAVATVRGIEDVRVFRCGGIDQQGFWWTPEFCGDILGNEPQWRMHADQYVTDVRPLVVLDPEDFGTLDRLATLFHESWSGCEGSRGIGLGGALLKLTKPPRIPEPGLWGVVQSNGRNYVRTTEDTEQRWRSGDYTCRWSDLIDPTLIREGVES